MVIMNCSTNLPQVVSGPTNSYSGQWIVQCGWLQGTNRQFSRNQQQHFG